MVESNARQFPAYCNAQTENRVKPEEVKDDPSQPNLELEIEHVYGYRANDCSNNLHYNDKGEAVYMTAAVGIVMDTDSKKQRVYGGKEVVMGPKNIGDQTSFHRDDILSLSISVDRKLVVTGQQGSTPSIHVWNADSCEQVAEFQLPAGSRGVIDVSISPCSRYVACVDANDRHFVTIYNIQRQKQLLHMESGREAILGLSWSKRANDLRFATNSLKEVKFWHPADVTKRLIQKGVIGQKAPLTNMFCMDFDEEGWAYTGGENGQIYVWSDACTVVKAIKVHGKRITVVKAVGGKVLSGSKDQKVAIISAAGGNFKLEKFVDLGASFPNSLDFFNGKLIAGLRNGTILEMKDVLETEEPVAKTLMESHFDGEAWGLCLVAEQEKILTSGDDNKYMLIDYKTFTVERSGKLALEKSNNPVKSTASTMGVLAPNQQSRAIAYNKTFNHVAVSDNYGEVVIKNFADFNSEPIATLSQATEWNEVMRYSPCDKFLAVGSHDNRVYVYAIQEDGSYKPYWNTADKITSFVQALDWSLDSKFVRTTSGSHEKQYFDVAEKKHSPDGLELTKGMAWATQSMRFGWDTHGCQRGEDDSHINGVWQSQNGSHLFTTDDWGLLNVYNYPCMDFNHQARSYAGHSEHVVRAVTSEDGNRVFTIGGNDKTVIQWRRKE